ncbi:hypothetical protein TcasGA2_TC002145 [Tribolium castaneum]|uniref:Uncharacterized protein n=1 Tax=Tribolium castaneum TaxID=7070 RepID=D6WGS8_TRICA|nr:hypothetical protein TcasGA2_TC002145 [Tribolium castaneum]
MHEKFSAVLSLLMECIEVLLCGRMREPTNQEVIRIKLEDIAAVTTSYSNTYSWFFYQIGSLQENANSERLITGN